MLWRVRAKLQDRPGAMATLAARCGDEDVNILGLQIFPTTDGVVDELVLHAPAAWTLADVEALLGKADVANPVVTECTPRALEDQAVRYVRAAHAVIENPETLADHLCQLFDAVRGDGPPGLDTLELTDGVCEPLVLRRREAFTDTEYARAFALRQVATAGLDPAGTGPLTAVDEAAPILLRAGTVEDAPLLVAMHARCSAATVQRRYHAPMSNLPARMARALLEPVDGWSLVMTAGEDLVGMAVLGRDSDGENDVGLLVEDRWHRRGLGARLLRAVAGRAAQAGATSLSLVAHPDNPAVMATVRRAGFNALVTLDDGLLQASVPITKLVQARRVQGTDPGRRMTDVGPGRRLGP